jgi:hypothetical protein
MVSSRGEASVTRGRWLALGLAVALATASVLVTPGPQNRTVPTATVVAPAALPPAEAAYFSEVAPRLARASLDAAVLTEIGERRSRNLLEIRDAQTKMDRALDDLDAILAARPPPPRFAPSLATYRKGAAAIRDAMDEAQAGFVRFDWDRVAAASDLAETGAAGLRRSRDELAAAAGHPVGGTPVASPPAMSAPGRREVGQENEAGADVL